MSRPFVLDSFSDMIVPTVIQHERCRLFIRNYLGHKVAAQNCLKLNSVQKFVLIQ